MSRRRSKRCSCWPITSFVSRATAATDANQKRARQRLGIHRKATGLLAGALFGQKERPLRLKQWPFCFLKQDARPLKRTANPARAAVARESWLRFGRFFGRLCSLGR